MTIVEKQRIAVFYGARSVEHEISIITALQMMQAIDPDRYQAFPVYIAPSGKWYYGRALYKKSFYKGMPESLSEVQEVTLLPDPTLRGLKVVGGADNGMILPVDLVVLAFHGQYGEDGCIQGLLELADMPYTGSGVLGSSIAMDKYIAKNLLASQGIPSLPGALVSREMIRKGLHEAKEKIFKELKGIRYPLFVKPNQLGSSIAVNRACNDGELLYALACAFRFDTYVLVEPCVDKLLEINISVLDGNPPLASAVEIPLPSKKILSYDDKYLRGSKGKSGGASQGMASLPRIIDPPDLDPAIKQQIVDYALKAFELLRCSGVVRFDFIMDLDTQNLYFNEINSIPGSLSFYLWEKSSPQFLYPEVINIMIDQALRKYAEKRSVDRFVGFKALRC